MLTVRGAELVWTGSAERPGAEVSVGADGLVADGPVGGDVLDASGCVVTPGLVNAHHHLLQTAFRTLPGTRGVPMREWLPRMAAAYAAVGVDDELAHAAAAAGLAEALLCGVTTVADHHLTWPASTGDGVGIARAVAAAAHGLGARLVFVRGSARDDPQSAAASADAVASALADDPLVQVAVGPAGVHSDAAETFALLGEVAARRGLRRRTQANEQVDVEVAARRYGRRPLELLDEWGWLAPDVTLAHLCAITDAERDRVAAAGVSATHAPGCDLPMGWGVAPMAALADAGVAVGLGTSGGGSNDAGHLLADARLALQVAPLVGRPVSAREVLGWATAGGAAGLGRPELGSLEPGSAGDAVCWDVTGVADAGVADPLAGLLWAAPGRRPRHVVVGGRVVVRDGELVTRDEREVATTLTALLTRRG
ncbi:amidohydrolase family protein [Pseudonocardia lacus]|uniref:amidohydrolase family protein n=1 Tax=Pseudonocardia lacus TaxID=2835865 RepID=UPI0027E2AD0A|nr:amidohydrolase family protein [Pseudonocardia lacus]